MTLGDDRASLSATVESVQFGGRRSAGFGVGTVFGLYTVQDLDQLVQNKDVEMGAIGAAVAASGDPTLRRDWAALDRAYQSARAGALKAISDGKSLFVPDSLQGTANTDAAYTAVLRALQPVAKTVTPGSEQDVFNRLVAAGWKPDYQLPHAAQSDADVKFYSVTGQAGRAAAETAQAAGGAAKGALLSTIDVAGEAANKAADAAGSAVKKAIPWELWALAGVVVVALGVAVVKLGPVAAEMYLPPPRKRAA